MKLFVPALGVRLRLLAPWEFTLHSEMRNKSLLDGLGHKKRLITTNYPWGSRSEMTYPDPSYPCILDAGTVLQVDRIFIRKGKEDFNSITFNVAASPVPALQRAKGKRLPRFWAKLDEVNTMDVEVVS